MKHAILGAGAIGGLVGTALASLGEDISVIGSTGKVCELSARTCCWNVRQARSITAPAKAVAELTDPVDVLWIATKTYQLQAALEAVQTAAGLAWFPC